MLALLTQRLVEKIFARKRSGIQHWGLSECAPCTLFPLLQSIHRASPERPLLLAQPPPDTHSQTLHTQMCSTHGRMCVHSHTHVRRWVKCQVSHLMKRHLHANSVCLCRERPFYSAGQCLCWLFFVCTFLSTKSSRKNGGGGGEKKKSERHAIAATDMFRLIQALHSYLNLEQFSIQQSCSGVRVSHCVFDEDIFERLTPLTLTRHLSHTRGISLFSDDDDVLAELSKSADEADKRWRQAECVFTN